MELKDFVSKALVDIVFAVKEAQAKTPEGVIVPPVTASIATIESRISDYQSIEFEVTVKTEERAGTEAKLHVVASLFGVGGKGGVTGQSGTTAGHAAKLSFRVPIRFQPSVGGA